MWYKSIFNFNSHYSNSKSDLFLLYIFLLIVNNRASAHVAFIWNTFFNQINLINHQTFCDIINMYLVFILFPGREPLKPLEFPDRSELSLLLFIISPFQQYLSLY